MVVINPVLNKSTKNENGKTHLSAVVCFDINSLQVLGQICTLEYHLSLPSTFYDAGIHLKICRNLIIKFGNTLQMNLFPAGYSQIDTLCRRVRASGLRQSAPTPLYGALQKPVLTEDSQVSGEETVLECRVLTNFYVK